MESNWRGVDSAPILFAENAEVAIHDRFAGVGARATHQYATAGVCVGRHSDARSTASA